MAKKIRCPKCKSCNVSAVTTKRTISVRKGILGAIVGAFANFISAGSAAIIGLLSGRNGKTVMVCNDCGRTFKVKA